jgi:hypothetical protein
VTKIPVIVTNTLTRAIIASVDQPDDRWEGSGLDCIGLAWTERKRLGKMRRSAWRAILGRHVIARGTGGITKRWIKGGFDDN